MPVARVLTHEEVDTICEQALKLANDGKHDDAWTVAAPLLTAQAHDTYAANALLEIVNDDCFSHEHAAAVLEAVESKHSDDLSILCRIAGNMEKAIDIDFLNAAPPELPFLSRTLDALQLAWETGALDNETSLLDSLATAARLYGRQRDDLAERAYKRLIELDPAAHYRHYNYGLFLKTRGRFEEGMQANERAASLLSEPDEAIQWNLGICATGAGRADIALQAWKERGHHIEMGRFDLPEGSYPDCKVRLAERPLAERTRETDDPGQEETIWIERLSGCHGIVRSVLYYNLGVNYGDVILFDGAAITHHTYGDEEIPVFPHMATLLRRSYQFFLFAGTQDEPKRLMSINARLDGDAAVYSHTDNVRFLCMECWNNPGANHADHEESSNCVAAGQIAAPPDMNPGELLRQLDAALQDLDPCRLYSPELCRAAGLLDRAAIEQRRFDLLTEN